MKKILITGGAGFIGSHLADKLILRGDRVFVIDNLVTGKADNIHPAVGFFRKDIAVDYKCTEIFDRVKPDIVVHAAASYKDPDDWNTDAETNVCGTINIVKEAIKHNVERLIYFQTSLCYGVPQEVPITLAHPLVPGNSYAITKTAAERFITMSGLDYISFRLANCYGPRNLSGPIPTFYKKIKAGEECTMVDTRRDFVYVDDLLDIVLCAVDGQGEGIYHISTGRDWSIHDIYSAICGELGMRGLPRIVERGPDDIETILLSPSRTNAEFEDSRTPLDVGIAATMAWYEEHGVGQTYTHLKEVK